MSKSSEPSPNTDLPFTKEVIIGLQKVQDFSGSTLQEVDLTQTVLIDASFKIPHIVLLMRFKHVVFHAKKPSLYLCAQYGDFEDSSFNRPPSLSPSRSRPCCQSQWSDLQAISVGLTFEEPNLWSQPHRCQLIWCRSCQCRPNRAIFDNVFVKQTRITQTKGLSEEREQLFAGA